MLKRKRVALFCEDPSLAIQSQKAESDINQIVKNFGVTGRANAPVRLPQYGDFDTVSDYRSALEAIRQAEDSFLALPSQVRSRFDQDPQAFASFALDPSNLAQLREWGLAPTPLPAAPPAV